ncbi:hypothetical protein LRP67_01680 [Nocardioides sp. cx-169]|uniref:hypothetical protein n=1 Tax=Nocardioides sp. cx-169 TaxID=2899080 RepID=UPI001E5AF496|nr:hypothetical protein [Nocardioides sp. cx-169]MCD4532796.1 hypothetical protein [Nocardioides sp. cx-169]
MTGDHNGTYTAFHEDGSPDSSSPQQTRVFDRHGSLVLERTSEGSGWFTQEAWLTDHFAVVEDLHEGQRLVRLFVYDLRTGEAVELPGGLQPTQPEVDAGSGQVSFTTGTAETRMCQQLVDLESGVAKAPTCASTGEVLADTVVGASAYSFSRVRSPNVEQRCKNLTVVQGERQSDIPLHEKCLGWSAAVIEGAVAWDEADPLSESLWLGEGYVRPGDEQPIALGPVVTDTIVGCGDRFFWEGLGHHDSSGIESWSAEHGVQTVWGPQRDVVPVDLECSDGRWLHLRLDEITGKDEMLRIIVLDTRTIS